MALSSLLSLIAVLFAVLHFDVVQSKCRSAQRAPFRLPATVNVDRVRYCRAKLLCMSRLTRPEYGPLNRIGNKLTKKLIISEVVKPQREDTEHIVLAFAGQQTIGGRKSGITGQRDGYRIGWKNRQRTKMRTLMSTNLADRILGSGVFPKRNSFVGLVFDTQFNYEYLYSTKSRVLKAYLNYVKSKMGPKTKTVYLAGHSRGGCLAYRMAAELTKEFPKLRVIVNAFDPVCVVPRLLYIPEFGLTSKTVVNPTNRRYKVFTTDMVAQFQSTKCLSVRAFLSGDPILFLPIRTFGHSGFTRPQQSLRTASGRPWYTQSFHKEDHSIHLYYHRAALAHVRNSLADIPCGCSGT